MRLSGAAALLATVALAGACARGARVGSDPSPGEEREVTGTLRQAGSVPFVRLLIEGEDTVAVTGDLERELSRLVGARVRATGESVNGPVPGPHLRVTKYEILEVDGERPHLGWLRADEAGFWLESGEGTALRLAAVPPGLARAAGGKVWVVTGPGGEVQRYGIVIEP